MKAKRIYSLAVLSVLAIWLCLSGCSEDTVLYNAQEDAQKVSLVLNTRVGESVPSSATESRVEKLRAIVFEIGEDGSYKKQIKNETFGNGASIKITFDKCNLVRVILIANEREDWNLHDTSKTIDEIKNLSVNYGTFKQDVEISAPFVMFCESETLSGMENNFVTLQLEHNVARVDISLTCKASDVAGLNKGELRLTGVRIEKMAPFAGLGAPYTNISATAPEDYLTSTTLKIEDEVNCTITRDENGMFTGFTTRGLTLYVPEHYVTDKNIYTYITIFGTYIPFGSSNGVPVEYTLPLGSDITQAKIDNNSLTTSELTLQRNHLYQMNASFKSLQQVCEVYVNVKSWDSKNVNGSINDGKYYLNVSDLNPTLTLSENGYALVQFWSNLSSSDIRILPEGTIKNGDKFTVNDFFVSLADEGNAVPANINFVEGEKWGRLHLAFKPGGGAKAGETYIITLSAGPLQRSIEVLAVNDTDK